MSSDRPPLDPRWRVLPNGWLHLPPDDGGVGIVCCGPDADAQARKLDELRAETERRRAGEIEQLRLRL